MLERLGRLADGHAKSVVVLGLVFLVVAGALGGGVAKRLDPFGADDPATESVIADGQLQNAGYRDTGVVVLVRDVEARTADGRERIAAVARRLHGDRDVAAVASFLNTGSRDFISRDGRSTYLAVALRPTGDRARQDAAARIADALAHTPGVSVGGPALAERQVNEQVEHDLRTAELYAFPLLLVLSLLFFRSLVAALLPLLVGGLAIVATFVILRLASELTSVSIFALNVATGLGLGLAIDYSLFIVSRYSMGIAGAFVALIAAAISLTLLPALLTLLGPRVNALAPAFFARRAERDARPLAVGFWYRLAKVVARRPARIALAAALLLVALGLPFAGIKFTSVDAQVLPTSASARQVDDTLRADFAPYRDTPITLAVDGGPRNAARIAGLAAQSPAVAAVGRPIRLADDSYAINVVSAAAPLSEPMSRIQLSVGERAEILVRMDPGERAVLRSFEPDLGTIRFEDRFSGADDTFDLLELRAAERLDNAGAHPRTLVRQLETPDPDQSRRIRRFELGNRDINGLEMDMRRIDEVVRVGDTEIWEVENTTGMPHSFHVHDVPFRVIEYAGGPPPPQLSGLKDTVYVPPRETVRLVTSFEDCSDPDTAYMFHRHVLEHEDRGMMGQFVITDSAGWLEHGSHADPMSP